MSYVYRVELNLTAVLADRYKEQDDAGFWPWRLDDTTPPSVSGENPAVLCRHPIQKITPKQIRILRAYERVGEEQCVCSRRWSSPISSPPLKDRSGSPLLDRRRYDKIGTGRRDASEWGRRYFLDRQRIERQRVYYHQTADLLFYLDREDARSVVQEFVPEAPGAFQQLGLGQNPTVKDVKEAFRQRSKEVHPDQGGDKEEFIELRKSYEDALQFVS